MTPDDVGAAKAHAANLQPRARQNVVFELGYFVARLGRGKVAALRKGGVEIPSDYSGVLYIDADREDWRWLLAGYLVSKHGRRLIVAALDGVAGIVCNRCGHKWTPRSDPRRFARYLLRLFICATHWFHSTEAGMGISPVTRDYRTLVAAASLIVGPLLMSIGGPRSPGRADGHG